MSDKRVNVLLFLILLANEQVWSDTIPNFYNFSGSTGWYNHAGGNWKFTYNNDFPDSQHPNIDSDAGYTFSQDGNRGGLNGLVSPTINGVDFSTVFSFSYWFSSQTAYPGSGIQFYCTSDNFGTLLPLGTFSSNNIWEHGTIDCGWIACCENYPCNIQILVLNSDGNLSHPTVSALQWFLIEAGTTTTTTTSSTITATPSTTETSTHQPTTMTSTQSSTTPSTTMKTTETSTPYPTTERSSTTPLKTTTTESTTPFPTTTPSVITVMYNFSSCTTQWFNYGEGNWKFTCMDDYPDALHPQIDGDVGYTFSEDGLNVPMVGLSSPIITGVNAQTIFTFSYWFSLATAFPGSIGIEFYSSIDNFGTIQPIGNFISNNEWAIGSIDCNIVQCCADYPCDVQIMILNTKGDVDHPTVAALQWFSIASKTSN